MHHWLKLFRLHRPTPILLLLWPTYWGLVVASHDSILSWPKIVFTFVIFTLGVVIMRTAGCIINDLTDQKFDRQIARTADRPITSGAISNTQASAALVILLIFAFILWLTLNTLTQWMALVAIILTIIYPWMKRLIRWPQIVLGAAFNWGIVMAFTQLDAHTWLWIPGLFLYAAALVWTIAYDTIYAMADRDDDLIVGINSSAVALGSSWKKGIAYLQIATLALLIIAGLWLHLGWIYYSALVISGALFVWQHRQLSVEKPNYIYIFSQNHWVGLVILVGLLVY